MKTTLERPDPLIRKAKATAAARGQSLKEFVTEALRDKLSPPIKGVGSPEPEWMQGFSKLRRLRKETARIRSVVNHEFEVISPENRA